MANKKNNRRKPTKKNTRKPQKGRNAAKQTRARKASSKARPAKGARTPTTEEIRKMVRDEIAVALGHEPKTAPAPNDVAVSTSQYGALVEVPSEGRYLVEQIAKAGLGKKHRDGIILPLQPGTDFDTAVDTCEEAGFLLMDYGTGHELDHEKSDDAPEND